MFDESLNNNPIETHQPTIDAMLPIISTSSPLKAISKQMNDNTHSPPQRRLITKRLKKRSHVLLEQKIKQKLSTRFFDKEAELGSDNEEHDDIVKEVKDSEGEEDNDDEEDGFGGEDNDKDINIENLIDDEAIQEEEDVLQKEKFIEDEFKLDKERIRKVIDGPNKKQLSKKRKRNVEDEDINELPLHLRIEKMNNDNEEREEEVDFKSLIFNYKKIQNDIDENDDNEDLKQLYHEYQSNAIKRINKLSNQPSLDIKNRIKEDNKILQNVIIKNKSHQNGSASTSAPKINPLTIPLKSYSTSLNKNCSLLQSLKKRKEDKEKEMSKPGLRSSFIEIGISGGLFGSNYEIDGNPVVKRTPGIYSLFLPRKR